MGNAIDFNQIGRDIVTPEFKKWWMAHPQEANQLLQKWHIYSGGRFGDFGHFEWGGVPFSKEELANLKAKANQPTAVSTAKPEMQKSTLQAGPAKTGGEGVFGKKQYAVGSAQTEDAIKKAADKYGFDPNYMRSIGSIESDMDPNSNINKRTKYKGLFQIGPEEWAKYGQGRNIYDPYANADAAARMWVDQREEFRKRFGRYPTDAEQYMIHQQGMDFLTKGTMTNIAGNRYPGMHGPQSPESFQEGWGRAIEQRKRFYEAKYQDEQKLKLIRVSDAEADARKIATPGWLQAIKQPEQAEPETAAKPVEPPKKEEGGGGKQMTAVPLLQGAKAIKDYFFPPEKKDTFAERFGQPEKKQTDQQKIIGDTGKSAEMSNIPGSREDIQGRMTAKAQGYGEVPKPDKDVFTEPKDLPRAGEGKGPASVATQGPKKTEPPAHIESQMHWGAGPKPSGAESLMPGRINPTIGRITHHPEQGYDAPGNKGHGDQQDSDRVGLCTV